MAATADDMVRPAERAPAWGMTLAALAVMVLALVGLYFETAHSMYDQWATNDTYAHGFLIVPISLWLVWEKRAFLADATPRPVLIPLALMLPVGFLWLVARMVDVAIVQQYAFVALVILAIWSLVGHRIARYLAFPIGFLLFAVPVGEGLIYPMINFTADFTVGMLRLTGIPVYRDGTFFSIPSGNWSVVTACSGIRYLLASVTLGVLYAYLTYTKTWKRLVFVLFSVAVPILANGLRAYMIVMIGHLSDMRLATGVDHLIYGWVFFGIVIAIMFAIGAIWRDPPDEAPRLGEDPSRRQPLALVMSVGLALAAAWPAAAWMMERPGAAAGVTLQAPDPAPGIIAMRAIPWDWRPHIQGTDGSLMTAYRVGEAPVSLYIGLYRTQRQGSELVQYGNRMVKEKHPVWSNKEITPRRIEPSSGAMTVEQGRLDSMLGQRLLVWSWYQVGDYQTSHPVLVKVAEAVRRLFTGHRDGAVIAVATPVAGHREDAAAEVLEGFIGAMDGHINAEIERALAAPAP